MIERLTLENFKSHRDTQLTLSPLTVFVGPNGSGKTSALEAIHYLGQVLYKAPHQLFTGARDPDNLVSHCDRERTFFRLGAGGTSAGKPRYVELHQFRTESWRPDEDTGEEFKISDWHASLRVVDAAGARDFREDEYPFARQVGDLWPEVRSAVLLRLDARKVAAASAARQYARVEYDGSGCATVLANLTLTDPKRVERILSDLRRIVPQVERVRAEPATIRSPGGEPATPGFRLLFDFRGASSVPAPGVSEGTLLMLALVTILNSPKRPRTLLLDDINEALHPRAQSRLMQLLRELTLGDDPVQIITTTHSPYILDAVDPSTVQVFALREDGTTAVKPLSEHPDAATWTGSLSAGQLWSLDDEQSWVVEQRP